MLFLPRQDVVVALTSPPLVSWLGSIFTRLKGGRLVFWVMDLNPDEAVAAGWLKEQSPQFKDFDWQDGYGAFSIGLSQRGAVVPYIRSQQQRHARLSFQRPRVA